MTQKKTYEKPRFFCLTENQQGKGECTSNGSGDSSVCVIWGNSATPNCSDNGMAADNCSMNGASAIFCGPGGMY